MAQSSPCPAPWQLFVLKHTRSWLRFLTMDKITEQTWTFWRWEVRLGEFTWQAASPEKSLCDSIWWIFPSLMTTTAGRRLSPTRTLLLLTALTVDPSFMLVLTDPEHRRCPNVVSPALNAVLVCSESPPPHTHTLSSKDKPLLTLLVHISVQNITCKHAPLFNWCMYVYSSSSSANIT